MTPTIDPAFAGITLINVFTPRPGMTDAFARLQAEELHRLAPQIEGYVSANLHVSLDGRNVVNYAQFTSLDAFQAWRASDLFKEHFARIAHLIEKGEPQLYRVADQAIPAKG
jgi:heme-degrading monooxygenase HmoA